MMMDPINFTMEQIIGKMNFAITPNIIMVPGRTARTMKSSFGQNITDIQIIKYI